MLQQQKGEKRAVDELMMDFNWGDEIEIYKEEFHPPQDIIAGKKIIFFN